MMPADAPAKRVFVNDRLDQLAIAEPGELRGQVHRRRQLSWYRLGLPQDTGTVVIAKPEVSIARPGLQRSGCTLPRLQPTAGEIATTLD
jgi:hypothetical protein